MASLIRRIDSASVAMQHTAYAAGHEQLAQDTSPKKRKLSRTTIVLALAFNGLVAAGVGVSLYQNWDNITGQIPESDGLTTITDDDASEPMPIIGDQASEMGISEPMPIIGDQASEMGISEPMPPEMFTGESETVVADEVPELGVSVSAPAPSDEFNARADARVDEQGRVLISLRPVARPAPSLLLYENHSDKSAVGCGMQPRFDEFWVNDLDKTPEFRSFLVDYTQRMQFPLEIHDDSIFPHRRGLQLMLGLNECYTDYNRDTYDGVLGAQTSAAIGRFQQANNLDVTGHADNETMQYLVHASAMRIIFNMYVLDYTAHELNLDTQGVFQLAWHESMYVHTAVSRTGADGIGQMIDSTFMEELQRSDNAFLTQYTSALFASDSSQGNDFATLLTSYQHNIWTGSYAMLSHCKHLLDTFNAQSCEDVYGAYQLGAGGYRALRHAAETTPNKRANRVTAGTTSNGYGDLTAQAALAHVNGLIDSAADRARAAQDIAFLRSIVAARAVLIDNSPDNATVVVASRTDMTPG